MSRTGSKHSSRSHSRDSSVHQDEEDIDPPTQEEFDEYWEEEPEEDSEPGVFSGIFHKSGKNMDKWRKKTKTELKQLLEDNKKEVLADQESMKKELQKTQTDLSEQLLEKIKNSTDQMTTITSIDLDNKLHILEGRLTNTLTEKMNIAIKDAITVVYHKPPAEYDIPPHGQAVQEVKITLPEANISNTEVKNNPITTETRLNREDINRQINIKTLIRLGKITEHDVNEHPAYVNSFLKKSRYRSRSPSPVYHQVKDTPTLKVATVKTDENEAITKASLQQYLKEKQESTSHQQFVQTTCNLSDCSTTPRIDEITRVVKKLKNLNIHDVATLGLHQYLEQFPVNEFLHLNQREYNIILSNFIGSDLSKKCAKNRIMPQHLSTTDYINELHNLHSNCSSEFEVEEKLLNYTPKEENIQNIWVELTNIVDLVDSNTWSETYKNKKLFWKLRKLVPDFMMPTLYELQVYNIQKHTMDMPSRAVMRNFVIQYSHLIDGQLTKKKNRVNMVEAEDDILPQARIHASRTLAPPAAAPITIQPPAYMTPMQPNMQYQMIPPPYPSYQITPNNRPQNSYNNNQYRSDPRQGPRCDHCNRFGHVLAECFFHPEQKIAFSNQKLKGRKCLLCCNFGHHADTCTDYPGIVPVLSRCAICKEKQLFTFHPQSVCKHQKN